MGYTHHFMLQPGSAEYAEAWPQVVGDARRICDAVTKLGIHLAGPDGHGTFIVGSEGIGFNGSGAEFMGEPLLLPPPGPVEPGAPADCRLWRYVKTSRKPYDLAVTVVLLRCHMLLGDRFTIGSDGDWAGEWAAPNRIGGQMDLPSTRQLASQLFGDIPQHDPLTDPTEGMAISAEHGGWVDPRRVANPIVP